MKMKEINISECISIAFNNSGYEMGIQNDQFKFDPLNIEISGEIEDFSKDSNSVKSTRLRIKIIASENYDKPIYEFVYGWGDTYKEAVINSFERWIESDFPVIHDWLADHKIGDEETKEFKVASKSGETGETISWMGILGPILSSEG